MRREAGPIGGLIDAIRETLDPWLGKPKWKQGRDYCAFDVVVAFTRAYAAHLNTMMARALVGHSW